MRTLKWTVIVVFTLMVGVSLHYILPRSEVVRIVGVTERMETLGWNRFFYAATPSGQSTSDVRDVRLIQTIRPDGSELIFRNEDTGWIWPPYLKFDSADMHARGMDMASTSDEPVWVVISFYGVRSAFLSIYPNALRISLADGADVRLIPWTRIIVAILLVGGGFWLWFTLHRRFDGRAATRAEADGVPVQGRFGRMWQRLTGA